MEDNTYYARLPGLPKKVKWPVKLIDRGEVYCHSDDAYFSVNEDTLEKFPNRKIFERGIALLKKKPETLTAFIKDVEWATENHNPTDEDMEEQPCSEEEKQVTSPLASVEQKGTDLGMAINENHNPTDEDMEEQPCSEEEKQVTSPLASVEQKGTDLGMAINENHNPTDEDMEEQPCSEEEKQVTSPLASVEQKGTDLGMAINENHNPTDEDMEEQPCSEEEKQVTSPLASVEQKGTDLGMAINENHNPTDEDMEEQPCSEEEKQVTSPLASVEQKGTDLGMAINENHNPTDEDMEEQPCSEEEKQVTSPLASVEQKGTDLGMAINENHNPTDEDMEEQPCSEEEKQVTSPLASVEQKGTDLGMAINENPNPMDKKAADIHHTVIVPASDSEDCDSEIWSQLTAEKIDLNIHDDSVPADEKVSEPSENIDINPEQCIDIDDIDDDECLIEEEILRDEKFPRVYIKKVQTSETTKSGKIKKKPRVYNSYHSCKYCEKLVSNLSQHMTRNHLDRAEVKKIYDIADESKRKEEIALLSAKMDNTHNLNCVKNERGEILLFRRPKDRFKLEDYGPCPQCFVWTSKKMMTRHQSACIKSNARKLTKAEILTRSDIVASRIEATASPALRAEVLESLNCDQIGNIARADPLIVGLGNIWMEKNIGNKLKRGKYTRDIMRLVANLLCNIREETRTEETFTNYLKPAYFHSIAKATLTTAGIDLEDAENLEKPSNAVKLGHDIKRLANIKIGLAIIKEEKKEKEEAEDFLRTMNVFWGTKITKLARNLLVERQFNKRPNLPEPQDIQKLNEYLNAQLTVIDLMVVDIANYTHICKILCAKLVSYNRRRPGEIEAIRLTDYGARVEGAKDSTIVGSLTAFEQKLMETQEIMTTRGKLHRGTPVLIPDVAKAGMKFIADPQVRKTVKINGNSPFLFATRGAVKETIRVYESLAESCEMADLQYPNRITATTLRKYMATITQALDLKPNQMDWVLKHMGHTLDIHNIHYRQTSDVIERTKIAKILLLQDSGRLAEFYDKSLDEIQFADLAEPVDSENGTAMDEEGLVELMEHSEALDAVTEIEEGVDPVYESPKQRNSAVTRKKWSKEEEEEIRKYFKPCFDNNVRPTPKQCLKAIRISKEKKGQICNRKKNVLKKKVFRMIDSQK